jgi:hypothetical protein
MRRLVFVILGLIALFSALRAYTEPVTGLDLQPGLIEIGDGSTSVGMAFGAMQVAEGSSRRWSLLPLRVVYESGQSRVSIGLNGLTFLLRNGVTVGRPVRIDTPREGDVISLGGRVRVDSKVSGDVWTLGADVELTPRAEVAGNVVALGGRVSAAKGSIVRGTVNEIPELKIPFVGILGSDISAQVLGFGRQALAWILLGIAMFLVTWYLGAHARALYVNLTLTWREAVITVAVSLVVVPVLAVLLVVSVVGIFFLPVIVLVIALFALDGFLMLCARLGGLLRRRLPSGTAPEPMAIFTSGLLGLFLVMLPALVGISLGFLRSPAAGMAGRILQLVTLGLEAAGLLYGMGASLASAHARSTRAGT